MSYRGSNFRNNSKIWEISNFRNNTNCRLLKVFILLSGEKWFYLSIKRLYLCIGMVLIKHPKLTENLPLHSSRPKFDPPN